MSDRETSQFDVCTECVGHKWPEDPMRCPNCGAYVDFDEDEIDFCEMCDGGGWPEGVSTCPECDADLEAVDDEPLPVPEEWAND